MANPKAPSTVLSHWSTLLENFNTSSKDFYVSVEEGVRRREVPDTATSRIDYHEGGVFSAQREYLRVARGKLVFDVCAAPYGKGFFISSWLAETRSPWGPLAFLAVIFFILFLTGSVFVAYGFMAGLFFTFLCLPAILWSGAAFVANQQEGWDDIVVAMPLFGPLYERFFRPETYYRQDTRIMFQTSIHNAVLEAVDGLTSAKGLKVLSESERKPIMRDFLK